MELVGFMQVIWKKAWLIASAVVLTAGMTYVLSATSTPTYSATSVLEISLGLDPSRDPYSSLRSSELVASTYVEQILSTVVLKPVIDALGLDTSVGALKGRILAEQLRDTQLIRIEVQDASPVQAKELADRIAQSFIAYNQAKQRARYEGSFAELERQIGELEAEIEETQKAIASLGDPADLENRQMPELVRLEWARLQSALTSQQTRYTILLKSAEDFRLATTRSVDTISLFAAAEVPSSPVAPRTILNTMLGVISGLVLGVSAVFVIEYLDDTLTTAQSVEGVVGWPVLASIARMEGVKRLRDGLTTRQGARTPQVESYQLLRANLQAVTQRAPHCVVLVSSADPRVGKTTTCVNLGVAYAQLGKSVILVDADIGRASLGAMLSLPQEWGLTDIVRGDVGLDAALLQTEVEGLQVLCLGPEPPIPATLFESPAMAQLVAELRERADIVLIDAPPVLGLAYVALLTPLTDGTLIVVEVGKTKRDALRQTADALDRIEAHVLGIVLNKSQAEWNDHSYHAYYAPEHTNGKRAERMETMQSLNEFVAAILPPADGMQSERKEWN
jgi:capsular exopolysaccharide synthesis family protein